MPWKTIRARRAGPETADCWWCWGRIPEGAEVYVLVPAEAQALEDLPELCSPSCAKKWADGTSPEVLAAARELRRLEAGATLDGVLGGEAGKRWIREACDGDEEIAQAALRMEHPGASLLVEPPGRSGESAIVWHVP